MVGIRNIRNKLNGHIIRRKYQPYERGNGGLLCTRGSSIPQEFQICDGVKQAFGFAVQTTNGHSSVERRPLLLNQ